MPGLIDAHWHAAFTTLPAIVTMTADPGYIHIHMVSGRNATATLMRGFTTIRDCGGPVFGLKRATDEGVVLGPHIFPSGAFNWLLMSEQHLLMLTAGAVFHDAPGELTPARTALAYYPMTFGCTCYQRSSHVWLSLRPLSVGRVKSATSWARA